MARILIAAKDSPVRKAIHGALAGAGHKVRCVDHGAAAHAALQAEPAELVICDAFLPVIDGVALMMIGRQDWRGLPFLLMSEDPNLAEALSSIEVAVDGVIAKPFSVHALRHEVARLLPIGSEAA